MDASQHRVAEVFDKAPFIAHLNLALTGIGDDWVETELKVTAHLRQQHGFAHAGVVTTLAHHTAGAAASMAIADGQSVLTADFNIHLLRPAAADRGAVGQGKVEGAEVQPLDLLGGVPELRRREHPDPEPAVRGHCHPLRESLRRQVVGMAVTVVAGLVAGVVVAIVNGVSSALSFYGIKVFPAVILGGLDSIAGAVLGGIIVWFWLLKRALKGQFGKNYFGPIDYAALYWHLVDLIWIYLFPLLYLID